MSELAGPVHGLWGSSPLERVSWRRFNATPASIHPEPERETEACFAQSTISLYVQSKENAH